MKTQTKQRIEELAIIQHPSQWRHRKTGKIVTVQERVGYYGLHLVHDTGNHTCKLENYFVNEYEHVPPTPPYDQS